MQDRDIRCPGCGKLLAQVIDNVLQVVNGNKAVRVYGAVAVAIDCPRCTKTVDLPGPVPVAIKVTQGA